MSRSAVALLSVFVFASACGSSAGDSASGPHAPTAGASGGGASPGGNGASAGAGIGGRAIGGAGGQINGGSGGQINGGAAGQISGGAGGQIGGAGGQTIGGSGGLSTGGTAGHAIAGSGGKSAAGSGGKTSGGAGGQAIAGAGGAAGPGGAGGSGGAPTRDFSVNPVLVDLPAATTLFAVSDVHGGFDRLVALLSANGVAASTTTSTSASWLGGDAVLVVVGDLFDKGAEGIEVIEFFRALQADATTKGGTVVVTLGNHEAEFFVDPLNTKANGTDGLDVELKARGIDPMAFANGADARGAWLRSLPFGVRVGGWFFAHAGDTQGLDFGGLSVLLQNALTAHPDYDSPDIVGDASILESNDWYSNGVATKNAATMGVTHLVMGHDPNALGPRGTIETNGDDSLLRIDCGLSPDVDDSKGKLLLVNSKGAYELDEKANKRKLF